MFKPCKKYTIDEIKVGARAITRSGETVSAIGQDFSQYDFVSFSFQDGTFFTLVAIDGDVPTVDTHKRWPNRYE